MRSYNYLANEMPRELIEIYNDIEQDILRLIVQKLKKGENPTKVFQRIKDTVDGYNPKIEKVVQMIFADSKKKAVKDNVKMFHVEQSEESEPVSNEEANALIAPALIAAMAVISDLNRKIINNAVNKYTKEYQYTKSQYGDGLTRLKQVYGDLAKNGLSIYENFGGGKSRNYSIENVLRRDVMYKVNQANAKVNMENFKKSSAKFVEVSSHPTARTATKYMKHPYEDHSSWQGKVYYSRDGEVVSGYEEFESTCGYGELLGIGGINCYHQFQMNYSGESSATEYSKKEVQKQYALSQEQRGYERAIRKLKQAKAVYEEAGEQALAKSIGKSITSATGHLKSFCEKNDLKYYNWRTQI